MESGSHGAWGARIAHHCLTSCHGNKGRDIEEMIWMWSRLTCKYMPQLVFKWDSCTERILARSSHAFMPVTGRSCGMKLPFESLKQQIFVSPSGFALCILGKLGHRGHMVLQEANSPFALLWSCITDGREMKLLYSWDTLLRGEIPLWSQHCILRPPL